MVIVQLKGGLGNQMFQYAAAVRCQGPIFLDLAFLERPVGDSATFTRRAFELDIFRYLACRRLGSLQRKLLLPESRLKRRLNRLLGLGIQRVTQTANEFIEIPIHGHLYLDGYFQSEKYFRHCRSALLKAFTFPPLDGPATEVLRRIQATNNPVSLHIRRGDYLKPAVRDYHGVLAQDYYEAAITRLRSQDPHAHFFVFSDDPEYCRSIYGGRPNFTVVEGSPDRAWQDMALMQQCRHHIIANSSFSWWGAWLSTRTGITIAPRAWLNPHALSFDPDAIIPANWLQI
jgi:hypothetical protein